VGDSIKNKTRPPNDGNSAPGCKVSHTEIRHNTNTTPSQPRSMASTLEKSAMSTGLAWGLINFLENAHQQEQATAVAQQQMELWTP